MELSEAVVGNACDLIKASIGCQVMLMTIASLGKFLLVKAESGPAHGTMLIADGNDSQHYRDTVTLLVPQLNSDFSPFSIINGLRKRAHCTAKHAAFIITVKKNGLAGEPSDNVVPVISSNSFCAVIPEDDLPVAIDYIDSGLKAV